MTHPVQELFVELGRLRPAAGRTKRDFLSLAGLTAAELEALLALAAEVKAFPGGFRRALEGRHVVLAFEKPSLRTRVSFEVGARDLGAHTLYLSPADIGLGKREPVKDVARNLSRWVHALVVRTFRHGIVQEMADEAAIPVINALTDLHHPCQALADFLTLQEHKGRLAGLRLAWVGDGNNVAHSLAEAAARTGVHFTLATPRGYEPNPRILKEARQAARATGAEIVVVNDPAEAVRGADAVYTDVWASMGQEAEAAERKKVFAPFQVNAELMALARPGALFLHCLPAHRGQEVTDEVLDGAQSVALDQAENRLHAAKAVLLALLETSNVAATGSLPRAKPRGRQI